MAMVVQHNIAAQMALGELNKNNDKLRKSLEKVSNGQKINSAKDDASGYVISEKMREMVRTLEQDNRNVQNGSSLFKTAEGGINNIVEELRSLKELAINAANDTNTDQDRAIIQKEFTQKMANVNDIASETNYNGIPLLDGTWERRTYGETQNYSRSLDVKVSPSDIVAPSFNSIYKAVSEPSGNATMISGTDYTINSNGVYKIAAGFTGTITVNAQNVKITQADPSTALTDVQILGPQNGNANLWIQNVNISNSSDNVIKFQGENNVLSVKGDNIITETSSKHAAINIGGGLNVQGNGTHSLQVTTPSGSTGAAIGSDGGESKNVGNLNVYNLTLKDSYACYGSVIGSGGNGGSIGKVVVEKSDITAKGNWCGIIGSGHLDSKAKDIWIVDSKVNIGKVDGEVGLVDTGIGSGYYNSTCGNITILKSTVEVHNQLSACIGAGDAAKCGNIFISASKIKGQSMVGACVGSGQNGSTAGNIVITNSTSITHKSPDAAAIGSGASGHVGTITITSSSLKLLNAKDAYSDSTHLYKGIGRGRGGSATVAAVNQKSGGSTVLYGGASSSITVFNPLKIHHGSKANQATNFFINDMHTKSLGTGALFDIYGMPLNDSDLARYDALSYDPKLQNAWLDTLEMAQNKSLDDVSVTTQKNANVAIRVIDGAIDYALNESVRMGAYLSRLEYTDANVTTMGENVQAAESTIRDADMAKEMTEYTKNNVLMQASQSMLAQANQNSSSVLSLLQ